MARVVSILFLLTWSALTSGLPSLDAAERLMMTRSADEYDGYSTATVHISGMDRPLSRRDIEAHATGDSTAEKTFSLRMAGSGEELHMALTRKRSLDTSGIRFYEHTEEGKRELTDVKVRDCFFEGPLTDDSGYAHMAMCDGELMGSVSTKDRRTYEILSVPTSSNKRAAGDDVMQVLVSWKNERDVRLAKPRRNVSRPGCDEVSDGLCPPAHDDDDKREIDSELSHVKRGGAVKVEIGNYLDKYYIEDCASKLGKSSNQELIDLQILKWSSAASVMNNKALSYDVTLKLSAVTIMKSDPNYYQPSNSDKIENRMDRICVGTQGENFDQVTVSTSQTTDPGRLGLSWIGTVCKPRWRCAASRSVATSYHTEVHELGHTLGLNHDGLMDECTGDGDQNGFMSNNQAYFRKCYTKRLEDTFSSASCLSSNDVSGSVGSWNRK